MSSDPADSTDESNANQTDDDSTDLRNVVDTLAELKGAEEEIEHIEQVGEDLTDLIAYYRMVDKADVETASILADELATILNRVAAEHDEVTVGSVAFAHWLALEQLLTQQDETEENDSEGGDDDQTGGEESTHAASNGEGSQAQNTEGILLQSGEDQPATEVDPAFY